MSSVSSSLAKVVVPRADDIGVTSKPVNDRISTSARSTPILDTAVSSISSVQRTLHRMDYEISHPLHGVANIIRRSKGVSNKEVHIEIQLKKGSALSSYVQKVLITDLDPRHGGRSTLGYDYINLPEKMQNKGLSYFFHMALAEAALALDIEKVAIESVVSPHLEQACSQMGMKFGTYFGRFNADPKQLALRCNIILSEKGWLASEPELRKTRLGEFIGDSLEP